MTLRAPSLTTRLLTGQGWVFLAMAATMIVTGLLVGPPIFDEHMRRSGHADQPVVVEHADEAFRTAGLISLLVGLAIACMGAFLLSMILTRRITDPLRAFTTATGQLAAGEHATPVLVTGTRELAELSTSFNDMASQLAHTEAVRTRMLADLAHELRTPLAAINVQLEAWEDGIVPEAATVISTLRQQTNRLAHLTNDIKAVSEVDEAQLNLVLRATTLGDVLQRVWHANRDAAQRQGITLHATTSSISELPIIIDTNRIAQVLDNVVTNALRHTRRGGNIWLAAERSHNTVQILVRDDGDGIAAEHLAHVFDRFYRTDTARDRDHGGSGIGLTISREIVRAHHGRLTVTSDGLGAGATFTVELPLCIENQQT